MPEAEARATRRNNGRSIVVLGRFNPAIFQPKWLASEGLIRAEDADDAEVEIIHPDVAKFALPWCVVQVVGARMEITSTPETDAYAALKDLAVGVLQLLGHTPVQAVGANVYAHFEMANEKSWNELGWRLAPPQNWPDLNAPGLRILEMHGQRDDGREGLIKARFEPSELIKQGVFLHINSHVQLATEPETASAADVPAVLTDIWEPTAELALKVSSSLLPKQ